MAYKSGRYWVEGTKLTKLAAEGLHPDDICFLACYPRAARHASICRRRPGSYASKRWLRPRKKRVLGSVWLAALAVFISVFIHKMAAGRRI
ncbi:hypothetical protein [Hymenobacter saemangeumensis]|uniref:hypothetical protein n=1 Tax=Hymenobacter saemangeumensis TaxID=1084522 RepID=UPI0031F0CE8B